MSNINENAKTDGQMKEPAYTELEMRKTERPWPKSEADLHSYIKSLVNRKHDYGTCVYAMSLAAESAFNYVARELGASGFQASVAGMDFVKHTRGMKGPFCIVDGSKMLYPQYNLQEQLREHIESWRGWAADEAKKLLAEDGDKAHPDVSAHWKKLAEYVKPEEKPL